MSEPEWEMIPLDEPQSPFGAMYRPAPSPVYSGSILPFTRYSDGTVGFDSNAGLVGMAKRALSLPGDVARGQVDPLSEDAIRRSADLAGMGFGAGQFIPTAPGEIRMFGGTGSRTLNSQALELARSAESLAKRPVQAAQGTDLSPQAIQEATGWFRGKDGKLRYEIGDESSSLGTLTPKAEGKLSDALNHPELFAAYPELRNLDVKPFSGMTTLTNPGLKAGYLPIGEFNGEFNAPTIYVNPNLDAATRHSAILHEVQHAVQDIEGFGSGGNELTAVPNYDHEDVQAITAKRDALQQEHDLIPPSSDPNSADFKERAMLAKMIARHNEDIDNTAKFKGYQRISGEVEARNVQKRMNYSPDQRLDKLPQADEDVPSVQQTISPHGLSWAQHPTYVADPLDRVINGGDLSAGWQKRAYNNAERSRYILESQGDTTGRLADIPSSDDTQRWSWNVAPELNKIANEPTDKAALRFGYSKDLMEMQDKSFGELDSPERDTLAKAEWAIQNHGPEVLKNFSDNFPHRILPQEQLRGQKEAVNTAAFNQLQANHQRLIGEAKQYYADRAAKHFNLEPIP